MRPFALITAALAVAPGASAVDRKKSAIIWFENESTPDHIIDKARDAIKDAGGKITHMYSIIKGFAVIAPEKALEEVQVQTWATQHKMRVDEDEVMSTNE